ncbi:MAG: hypothetical protein AB7P03_01080 [Kofleriaceae bacterium]
MAVVSAGAATALGSRSPELIVAVGAAGGSAAAAIRALAGDSPASLAAAAIAPLLMIASWFDAGLVHDAMVRGAAFDASMLDDTMMLRTALAFAAMGWCIVELSRPTSTPLVAALPAVVAGVLAPSTVALIAIAGARAMSAPWQRPRWAVMIPVIGTLAIAAAVVAGGAHGGPVAELGAVWFGQPATPIDPTGWLARAGDALGPLTAAASIAGLMLLVRRRPAELALLACSAGAILVDLRAGSIGGVTIGAAALAAAFAIGRLAALIKLGAGQAIAGATAGLLLVIPPAWVAIDHEVASVAGPR